jgi:phosphatidylserine/phosphatidylglycerophosphate/cardiolipin synthase-like enzyme
MKRLSSRILFILLSFAVLFLLAACDVTITLEDGTVIELPLKTGETAVQQTPAPILPTTDAEEATAVSAPPSPTTANDPTWYDISFTDPDCLPEEERSGGLDELIAADLLRAQTQVDIAAYDLDAEPIVNALIELEKRDIPVRVVTDEDNADQSAIRRLRRNGISVVEDKRRGLMHNKFIIIDGYIVYTGSLNYTTNGVYCNNNNLVRIESSRLAANYRAEMDEMYNERQFGPDSPENTPNEQLTIGGVPVENYFAPEKKLAPIIADAVANAQSEILFMAFSFTEEQIGEAMLARAAAGVPVRGVFETVGSDSDYSYYGRMQDSGLETVQVRQDSNPHIMHHKVIIIDRETVIFGSFNFSDSANRRNDENILIVHDPVFTGYFVEEFETVWQEAKTEQ